MAIIRPLRPKRSSFKAPIYTKEDSDKEEFQKNIILQLEAQDTKLINLNTNILLIINVKI